MDKNRIVLLKAEINNQIKVIDEVYKRIEHRLPDFKSSAIGVESMAYQIHNLYGAYEELFEIVADFFENEIKGAKYHSDLPGRMKIEIEGIRPALISEESFCAFDELRRFRHLFRHAYNMELDPKRVEKMVALTLGIRSKFKTELDTFLRNIGA